MERQLDEVLLEIRDIAKGAKATVEFVKEEQGRLREEVRSVADKLDSHCQVINEQRIKALEARLDGLWPRVIGLITVGIGAAGLVLGAMK